MAFTTRTIDSLTTGKLSDPLVAGLFIEVQGSAKLWRYRRRIAGTKDAIRLSLGPWPSHDIKAARKWADSLNERVSAGIDPREQKAAAMTMEAAHALYMAAMERGDRKPLKPRTLSDKRIIWERDMAPSLAGKRLADVTTDDLWDLVEAKGAKAPVRANRLATEIKVFFGWLMSRAGQRAGVRLAADPSVSLSGKHYIEAKARTRFLSDEEIGWFLSALAIEGKFWQRTFLLLILTGARLGEVAGATEGEYHDGKWTIPAERSKNGEAHCVRLGPVGRHAFAWSASGDVSNIHKVRDRLLARMGRMAGRTIETWTPHDLRRTLRSNTFGLGIQYEVAEAMLNHVRKGLERRYDASDLSAQMEAGWATWEAHVCQIAAGAGVTWHRN